MTSIPHDKHRGVHRDAVDSRARQFKRAVRPRGDGHVSHDDIVRLVADVERAQGRGALPAWKLLGAMLAAVIPATFALILYVNSTTAERVKEGMHALEVQVSEMERRLNAQLERIEKHVERIRTKVESSESRLGTIELRLERIDSRLK